MSRGVVWSDEHIVLLRRAVLEKGMHINALMRLFPGRSISSIRSQLVRQELHAPEEHPCVPDLDFFDSYGLKNPPALKVV